MNPVVFHRPQRIPFGTCCKLSMEDFVCFDYITGRYNEYHFRVAQKQIFIAQRHSCCMSGRSNVFPPQHCSHASCIGEICLNTQTDSNINRCKLRSRQTLCLLAQRIHFFSDVIIFHSHSIQLQKKLENLIEIPVIAIIDTGRRDIQCCLHAL